MQIAIAVHRTSLLKLTCKIALLIAEREHFLNLFSHNIYSVSCQVVGTGVMGHVPDPCPITHLTPVLYLH